MHDGRMDLRLPVPLRMAIEREAAARGWTSAMYAREAIRLAVGGDSEGLRALAPRSPMTSNAPAASGQR